MQWRPVILAQRGQMKKIIDTTLTTAGAVSGDPGSMAKVGGSLFEFVFEDLKKQRGAKFQSDFEDLLAELEQARPEDANAFEWHKDRLEDPALAEMVAPQPGHSSGCGPLTTRPRAIRWGDWWHCIGHHGRGRTRSFADARDCWKPSRKTTCTSSFSYPVTF
ncbi:MAG: hypothetical protein V3V08_24300 [Nannocystaceae bacterium]